MKHLLLSILLIIPLSSFAQITGMDKYYPADTTIKKAGVKKGIDTRRGGKEIIVVEYDQQGRRLADYYQGNARKNNYHYIHRNDTLTRTTYVTINDKNPTDSVIERYMYNARGQILHYQKCNNATSTTSSCMLHRFTYNPQGRLDTMLLYGFATLPHRIDWQFIVDERMMKLNAWYRYTWYQVGRLGVGQDMMQKTPYHITDSNYYDDKGRLLYRHRTGIEKIAGADHKVDARMQNTYESLKMTGTYGWGQYISEYYPNGLLKTYLEYDGERKTWQTTDTLMYEYYK